MLRSIFTFTLLAGIKLFSQIFYRHRVRWVGEMPDHDPWGDLRVMALLNHTSLFEPLFAGGAPTRFLWRIARHGVLPVATKTTDRPLVGTFFRLVARQVIPITRQRDDTWRRFLGAVKDPQGLILMAPEGRMKRADGLDSHGRPMTVRGGIAEILWGVEGGRMLLVYSGGLHHVQVPGHGLPRLFKTLRMNLETVDIPTYRRNILESLPAAEREDLGAFKEAVKRDLEHRRDTLRPMA